VPHLLHTPNTLNSLLISGLLRRGKTKLFAVKPADGTTHA
jgi:hypothetical protein